LALSNNSRKARIKGRLASLPATPRPDEQFKLFREDGNEISGLKKDGEICDLMT
jgi:hypothetical protein